MVIGGAEIRPGDLVVMDCDGAMALPSERVDEVLPLALERAEHERAMRQRYASGELSYDLQGLREIVERLMEVAVLGLGEAGARIAADLVAAGCTVRGWDPAPQAGRDRRTPTSDLSAVRGADVVLSLNAAAVALDAAASVAGELGSDALYADLNTASPQLKRELAAALPVPVRGRRAGRGRAGLRAWRRPRSRPERAPSASPSSSGRSGCRSTWSARIRATPPA